MKIIDQTPFFNHETGEITMLDRGRAIMKYGSEWVKDVEGQREIIAVLEKVLDRNYTLLRNVTPVGLETSFPLILVGPAGVFVMYVTAMTGMYRAKGDQWGTITRNAFKNEKPNLLTRSERMARAIQLFLQRQGYFTLTNVDAILLCSDPSFNVDSVRPIIRVVMRDALERFAISLTQARVALRTDSIQEIVQRILNFPKPAQIQPTEIPSKAGPEPVAIDQEADLVTPLSTSPDIQAPLISAEPMPGTDGNQTNHRRISMNNKQWVLLILMAVGLCLLNSIFLFLVYKDQGAYLLSLLP